MITILRNAFARSRGAILGWGISLGLYGLFLVQFYDTLAKQQAQILQLLQSYPPELMAFFGDVATVVTPGGYLNLEFFSYAPLLVGIYAVLAGSGLLADDEEKGTLDLWLAQPVSRTGFFVGRLLAFVAAATGIMALTWVGFVVGKRWSESFDLGGGELALPFLSLLAVMLFFGAFALLLSLLLPSRRLAAMVAGLALVASFFVNGLARIDENLEKVSKFLPLHYYQGGDAVAGLNGEWFFGLLTVAALFTWLAWWRFERRDIRVGGEGGWRLPRLAWKKPAQT